MVSYSNLHYKTSLLVLLLLSPNFDDINLTFAILKLMILSTLPLALGQGVNLQKENDTTFF